MLGLQPHLEIIFIGLNQLIFEMEIPDLQKYSLKNLLQPPKNIAFDHGDAKL